MILLMGVLDLMVMSVLKNVQAATGSRYDLNQRVTLFVVNTTEEAYYDDGYVEGVEELTYSISATLAKTQSQLPPLQLFRQTGYDVTSRRLICIFDIADKCTTGPCRFKSVASKAVHQLEIKVTVTRALNNTRIGMRLVVPGGTYFFLTTVIRLHPVPKFSVSFDDLVVDINNCVYTAAREEEFVVSFCSENLKSPSLQVSLYDAPGEEIKHACAKQKFSVTAKNITIQLVYRDGCKVFGSFMCTVYADNQSETTTSIYSSTLLPSPPESSRSVLTTIFLTLLAIMIIEGVLALTALVYREAKKRWHRKTRKEVVMKKKRSQSKISNIIFEVYTETPSAVSTAYVETEAATVKEDFGFT